MNTSLPLTDMLNASAVFISLLFVIIFVFFGRLEYKARILMITGFSLITIAFFYDILITHRYHATALWIFPFVMVSYLLLYPLLYHYILNFLNDRKTLILDRQKFLFPLLTSIVLLVFYVPASYSDKLIFVQSLYLFDFEKYWSISLFFLLIYCFYYFQAFWFFYLFLKLYQVNREHYSATFSRYLPRWLFAALSASLLYEFSYTTFLIWVPSAFHSALQAVSLGFVVFFGLLGLHHDDIVLMIKMEKLSENLKNNSTKPVSKGVHIDAETKENLHAMIELLMNEQQLFRNPGLRLEHLAKRIHIPRQQLSAFINQVYKMNFSQLVNLYRIEYAKSVLKSGKEPAPLEELYPDFGFYSRSTFNRVFKTITGMSPAEFRHQSST